jgi:GxxExxY protein
VSGLQRVATMDIPDWLNEVTHQIIGVMMRVHRALGPGLLESVYRRCLAYELRQARFKIDEERAVPLVYGEIRFDCAYRVDMVVNDQVVIEVKSVESLEPVHAAQLLTYLRLTECPIGLLANFNTAVLKNGLKRLVNPAANIPPSALRETAP